MVEASTEEILASHREQVSATPKKALRDLPMFKPPCSQDCLRRIQTGALQS
jgi:hypothetical protein